MATEVKEHWVVELFICFAPYNELGANADSWIIDIDGRSANALVRRGYLESRASHQRKPPSERSGFTDLFYKEYHLTDKGRELLEKKLKEFELVNGGGTESGFALVARDDE